MRCVYKDTHIKIITPGGSEYIIPFNQEIIKVHAIHDGILIHAKHNADLLYYQHHSQNDLVPDQSPPQYSYFTVTKHPLNDV